MAGLVLKRNFVHQRKLSAKRKIGIQKPPLHRYACYFNTKINIKNRNMNESLKKIYYSKWDNLSKALNLALIEKSNVLKPSNPLLISLNNNNYENSDIKIMVFGQETNSWYEDFNNDFNKTLKLYDNFFNNGYAQKEYGSPFWQGINRFIELLKEKKPEKKIGLVWNNLIKIGCSERNANRPPEYLNKIEKEHFKIINEEVKILKPDIILFLSGPDYDSSIQSNFENIKFNTISKKYDLRKIAKLSFENHKNIYRTYHPKYLRMSKKTDEYFKAIIENVEI
jgi:hypothetical protein